MEQTHRVCLSIYVIRYVTRKMPTSPGSQETPRRGRWAFSLPHLLGSTGATSSSLSLDPDTAKQHHDRPPSQGYEDRTLLLYSHPSSDRGRLPRGRKFAAKHNAGVEAFVAAEEAEAPDGGDE